MKKAVLATFLSMALIFGTSIPAFADSGKSALPPRNPWKEYVYSHIAPKSQTSYKAISYQSKSVKTIKKEHRKIRAYFNSIGESANLVSIGAFAVKIPYIGTVASVVSGATFIIQTLDKKVIAHSLSGLKNKIRLNDKIFFKWTNPNKLEYSVKIVRSMTYNGHIIKGSTSTKYQKGSFAQGSN